MNELSTNLNEGRTTIYVLKYKSPVIENGCITRLLEHTDTRYTLSIVDTRDIDPNFSRIWNQLIRECPTEQLVIMDSDAYVERDWLSKMKEGLGADGCAVVLPASDRVGSSAQSRVRGAGCVEIPDGVPILALYKKDIFDKVGYFDEEFHVYGQDTEWMQRVRYKGFKIILQSNVFVSHLGHGSTDKAHQDGEINNFEEGQLSQKLWQKKKQELEDKHGKLETINI